MKTLNTLSRSLFLAVILSILAGCEAVQDMAMMAVPTETETDTQPLRVTMVYPSDCVGAAAYCDSFHVGLNAAAEAYDIHLTEIDGFYTRRVQLEARRFDIHLTDVEGVPIDPSTSAALMRAAARESDLVLTTGFQMGEPLAMVAPEFPDVNFVIFDAIVDLPNVASINYRASEGSFLVGAIAGLKTETDKIGYIGGVDVPLLREFEAGYAAGIRAVNPDAEILIEYISEDVSGFEDPEKAKELALAQYASGIDIIYVAAGGSGQGVLEAAQTAGKYIIWVDSNGNPLAPGIVLTSMVKELGSSAERIIQDAVEGRFTAGIRYLGIADGGVSYALDQYNAAALPDEVIVSVEVLKARIIAGDLVVPNTVSLPRE